MNIHVICCFIPCTYLYYEYLCYSSLHLNIYVILSFPFFNISVIMSHTYIPFHLHIYVILSLSYLPNYIPSNHQ